MLDAADVDLIVAESGAGQQDQEVASVATINRHSGRKS